MLYTLTYLVPNPKLQWDRNKYENEEALSQIYKNKIILY